jgi:hypothetical protein
MPRIAYTCSSRYVHDAGTLNNRNDLQCVSMQEAIERPCGLLEFAMVQSVVNSRGKIWGINEAHYTFDSVDVCGLTSGLALGSGQSDGNTKKMRPRPNQRIR